MDCSVSNSSNKTTASDWNQHVDKMSAFLAWDFSFSEQSSLAFFLMFLGCALFSSTANGLLFFLTVRYKQLLWQPQYILLKNMSACGFGMTFVTTAVVLFSIVRKQTQIYGCWCIIQFCILRCFFLMSQMTLSLMAIERYIFICHAIHYLRLIKTNNVHMILGLMWLVSVAVSIHGGLLLSQIQWDLQQQTSGLLCNAVLIKEHITFSQEKNMLLFGPPSVITTFCILAICYCYGCMYRAALRVSMALKYSNHRANCTVGLYLLMFLLQVLLSLFFVTLTMMGKAKAPFWRMITPILTPLLIIIPPCINAAFLLIRNPQIKKLVFSLSHQKWQSVSKTEVEELQQVAEEHTYPKEDQQQVERENMATAPPPLPGNVFPCSSEEC